MKKIINIINLFLIITFFYYSLFNNISFHKKEFLEYIQNFNDSDNIPVLIQNKYDRNSQSFNSIRKLSNLFLENDLFDIILLLYFNKGENNHSIIFLLHYFPLFSKPPPCN